VVNILFMKLLKTSDINIVRTCQHMFDFELPSVLLARRTRKFVQKNEKFMSWELEVNIFKIDCSLIVMFFTILIIVMFTLYLLIVFSLFIMLYVFLLLPFPWWNKDVYIGLGLGLGLVVLLRPYRQQWNCFRWAFFRTFYYFGWLFVNKFVFGWYAVSFWFFWILFYDCWITTYSSVHQQRTFIFRSTISNHHVLPGSVGSGVRLLGLNRTTLRRRRNCVADGVLHVKSSTAATGATFAMLIGRQISCCQLAAA